LQRIDLIGTQNSKQAEETANNSRTNQYPELRRLIKEQGLLDKQPVYYYSKILSTLGLLALSITLLVVVDNFLLQRIGRTARMGRDGTAITFVTEWDFPMLDDLLDSLAGKLRQGNLSLYEVAR
jgi:hypothetical protein